MFLYFKHTVLCLVLCTGLFETVGAVSLTRKDAVAVALTENLEMAAAQYELKAQRARALKAWPLPDPELELEWEGMGDVFGFGSFEERQVGVTQRLEFPVKWWLRGQVATAQSQASKWQVYEPVRQKIALRVLVAYDRVLADQQILKLSEENLVLAQHLLGRAKKRFEAGDVPQLDVMQTVVAVGRQENRVVAAQNQLAVSRAEFNVLLNRDLNTPVVLVDSLWVDVAPDFDLDQLATESVRRRPEFMGATRAYAGAQKARALAVMSVIPDVSLGISRQTVVQPAGRQQYWRTGIAIELPVWAWMRQRGDIVEAQADLSRAKVERDLVRQRVKQDVQTAYYTVQAAFEQVKRMQSHIVPTAKAAYDMARKSYDAGKASYLDLIEAQRNLIETQTEYVERKYDYRVARAHLFYAMGNGLMTEEMAK